MEKNGHKFISIGNATYDLTSLFGASNEPTSINDDKLQKFLDNHPYLTKRLSDSKEVFK